MEYKNQSIEVNNKIIKPNHCCYVTEYRKKNNFEANNIRKVFRLIQQIIE
jgi:hypothetical protein